MRQLLLFIGLMAFPSFAQTDCNGIARDYTGTCVSYYTPNQKSYERTYENGNVKADTRFNKNGDTMYTYRVTGEGTLCFDRISFSPGNKRSYAIHMYEGTGTFSFYQATEGYLECVGVFKDSVAVGDWIYYDAEGNERIRMTETALNKEKFSSNLRLTVIMYDPFQFMQGANKYMTIRGKEAPWVITDKEAANEEMATFYEEENQTTGLEVNQLKKPKPPIPPPIVVEEPAKPLEPVVEFPDKEPRFPGGADGMRQYFKDYQDYPQVAVEQRVQGKVMVKFVIEKDGSTSNVKVVRGVSKELDQEAKRLIRRMPKWTPGEANGKVVRTLVMVPIKFELSGNDE